MVSLALILLGDKVNITENSLFNDIFKNNNLLL